MSEKFTDPAEAEQAAAMCKGAAVTCTSVTKEQKKEQPPKLYDLTTLQREANRLFGYTAKQTLDYAQSLYEKKLLTYPQMCIRDRSIATDGNISSAIWACMGYTVLLCFALFKTGSLSKSLFGAH